VEHCDERVEALAQFQQSCILQALRFPALRRLVYSTCRSDRGHTHRSALHTSLTKPCCSTHTHTWSLCYTDCPRPTASPPLAARVTTS
jgi:hypothetical protein